MNKNCANFKVIQINLNLNMDMIGFETASRFFLGAIILDVVELGFGFK